MKKLFAVSALSLTCLTAIAAPIANAPLATPVLVDSTGKLMGRYVDGALLITVAGETVALPLRPRVVNKCYESETRLPGCGIRSTAQPSDFVAAAPRPGFDWQEGRVYMTRGKEASACLGARLPVYNEPSSVRYLDYGNSKTRYQVGIFGLLNSIQGTGQQTMYASISNGPQIYEAPVSVVTKSIATQFSCMPLGASDIAIIKTNGIAQETALINLDDIGIAPFFVK
jgi:hypothetical protein